MKFKQIGSKELYELNINNKEDNINIDIVKSYNSPIIFINWTTQEFYLSEVAYNRSMTTSKHTNIYLKNYGKFSYWEDEFKTIPHNEMLNKCENLGLKVSIYGGLK